MTFNSANSGVHISDFRAYGSLGGVEINDVDPSLIPKSADINTLSRSGTVLEEFKVIVYPVPFSNHFTIRIDSPNEDLFDMTVSNLIGEIVYSELNIPVNIDKIVNLNVNPGIYIIKLSNKEKNTNIKVIKH